MWSKSCIRSNWCYGKFFEVSTCNLSMNIGLYREIFFLILIYLFIYYEAEQFFPEVLPCGNGLLKKRKERVTVTWEGKQKLASYCEALALLIK